MTGPNVPTPPMPGEPIRPPMPTEVQIQDPDIVPNPDPEIDPSIDDEPISEPEPPMIEPPM